uniref:Adhesion G protein-coupled receptor A3 n=1 Tax=Cyprinus carpio TaxID=7962 RepID=A0A8C1JMW8_CYPCA
MMLTSFSSLSQGIFDSLGSLKILEFDSPYLLCDCNLQWLVVWIKEKAIGVKETRCSFPRSLQSQLITSLRPETLTCDAPLELPSFQMTPSQHQIVFQGDSLPFQCMASFVDEDMQVLWYQDGKMVEPDVTQGIYIEKSMVQNCSLIASALTISNIQPGFTGNWECRVRTSRGNNTRTVHIVVLESSAKYCLPDRVSNNKGDYRWPRTLAGITAYLPCKRQVSGAGIYSGSSAEDRRAWRRCGRSGQWAEDDYSHCEYMKDVTRVLYIINQMPLNLTNAVQTAQQLLAYTAEAPNFSDKVDVIFVAEMIEKISRFAEKYKELGDVMVDISSNLMLADERVLWMAQREARACSRIVECLQRIALLRISNGALAYSTDLNRTGNDTYSFEPLHPVIYATAIILVLCLLSVIVSYIYHHKSVRVSKKCWHMLVNLCLHFLLTCAVFVGGINQTYNASICQAVGIVLHYSTLASALWSGVTARNIYKQVTRKAKRYEELDEPPPPPRPMLRFYLIGGGIPIIVCGITAAANIKNYGSQANAPYCWMAWEPSLGAFYGPAAFIVFVDCMYFLSILVQLRRHPERRFELKEQSEEQQHLSVAEATEITPAHLESSSAAQPVPMSALENEHTFVAQLIGVAGSLALYVALWVFGALAVSQEHPADLVFTCLFGAAALALGAFLVAHHCVNRQDMRRHWSRACCLVRRNFTVEVDSLLLPVAGGSVSTARGNGETAKCPASSAESSCTNKSAPSVRNSTQGCKLTNLQVEAAQCKAVQYRPSSVNNNNLPGTGNANINGHSGRHLKNRARAHRASRLTVLRDLQARNSRRAAYLAYRERQQSQLQQDSSDASTSVPRRSRHLAKGGGVRLGNSFGHGLSNSVGNGVSNGGLAGGGDGSGTDVTSQTRDCQKQPLAVELEVQPKSYGLNLACQNGPAKDAERLQNLSPLNVESSGNIKTGLWKHETAV